MINTVFIIYCLYRSPGRGIIISAILCVLVLTCYWDAMVPRRRTPLRPRGASLLWLCY